MRRREFITLLGSVAAWPIAARAQQPDRMRLIGVLIAYAQNDSTAQSWLAAFRAALATLGWTEGSNLRMELRWSAADADVMRKLAKELVDLRPNAIFGVTTPAIGALARETTAIPIVFAGVSDPIGSGFVANLAHPGGNITGFSLPELSAPGAVRHDVANQVAHVVLQISDDVLDDVSDRDHAHDLARVQHW